MNKRLKVVAGILAGATMMLAMTPAMARTDVDVRIGLPGIYLPPPPIYVQPAPIYYQPQPYYMEREYRGDRHRGHWRHRHGYRGGRDRDGDGVPNRYDSRPNNPYRY
ncbi:MAG: hypothetical protein V4632_05130 [Pseudomonadota bacterium]